MSEYLTTVLSSAAVSTVLVGALGWLLRTWIAQRLTSAIKFEYDKKLKKVSDELLRLREDRTRKLEGLLRHYERQIEEFYGPLWNMVHQLYVCNHTKSEMTPHLAPEQAAKVEDYYQNTYFIALHEEIREIIKTKLYLIEGAEMPESFYAYLKHALQERDQRELFKEFDVDTSFLPGASWPYDFHDDIKNGFDTAMKNYNQCLAGLKA
jgi:hypothetical protein